MIFKFRALQGYWFFDGCQMYVHGEFHYTNPTTLPPLPPPNKQTTPASCPNSGFPVTPREMVVWKCQLHYLEFHITLSDSSNYLLCESAQVPSDIPCKDKQAEAEVSSTFFRLSS